VFSNYNTFFDAEDMKMLGEIQTGWTGLTGFLFYPANPVHPV